MFGTGPAERVRIQYGGSVKPDNAQELLRRSDYRWSTHRRSESGSAQFRQDYSARGGGVTLVLHAGSLGIGKARTPFRAEKSQLTNHSFLVFSP